MSFAGGRCAHREGGASTYTRAIETKSANGHMVFRLSEDEIKKAYYNYKNIAPAEPSATVVYAALNLVKFKPNDKVVFINSGKLIR
jgi:hypothetical protein